MNRNNSSNSTLIGFYKNVAIKGLILFIIINILFGIVNPMMVIGKLSFYNSFIPGRKRLPYGDTPEKDYNLSLFSIEAMMASHELSSRKKQSSEYRVILVGDSATWGYLLTNEQTLSGQLNSLHLTTPDGRALKSYNLGYPVMSLTKDLVFLSEAMQFQPDLILWLVTLESFPKSKQLYPPLLKNNPKLVIDLIENYQLNINYTDETFVQPNFCDLTLIHQRRNIADIIRLQFYGFMWAATGIDHFIPTSFPPRMEDLSSDSNYYDILPPQLRKEQLSFEAIKAGVTIAGNTPVLIINEPMFISQGENSDIRYNFYYPKWVYDDYRQILLSECQKHSWSCLDLWDAIDVNEFTNTAIHMTPNGTAHTVMLINEFLNSINYEFYSHP